MNKKSKTLSKALLANRKRALKLLLMYTDPYIGPMKLIAIDNNILTGFDLFVALSTPGEPKISRVPMRLQISDKDEFNRLLFFTSGLFSLPANAKLIKRFLAFSGIVMSPKSKLACHDTQLKIKNDLESKTFELSYGYQPASKVSDMIENVNILRYDVLQIRRDLLIIYSNCCNQFGIPVTALPFRTAQLDMGPEDTTSPDNFNGDDSSREEPRENS
jgi:hypothetical protein